MMFLRLACQHTAALGCMSGKKFGTMHYVPCWGLVGAQVGKFH